MQGALSRKKEKKNLRIRAALIPGRRRRVRFGNWRIPFRKSTRLIYILRTCAAHRPLSIAKGKKPFCLKLS